MGYIEKTLIEGETIIHKVRIHWIIFVIPILLLLISLVLMYFYFEIGAILSLLSLIFLFARIIRYYSSQYILTNKRLLVKIGFIRITTTEIMLHKVETIKVIQNLIGKIFNYGTVIIIGSGGSKESFQLIPNPLEFRKMAQEQIEEHFNKQGYNNANIEYNETQI